MFATQCPRIQLMRLLLHDTRDRPIHNMGYVDLVFKSAERHHEANPTLSVIAQSFNLLITL